MEHEKLPKWVWAVAAGIVVLVLLMARRSAASAAAASGVQDIPPNQAALAQAQLQSQTSLGQSALELLGLQTQYGAQASAQQSQVAAELQAILDNNRTTLANAAQAQATQKSIARATDNTNIALAGINSITSLLTHGFSTSHVPTASMPTFAGGLG